MTLWSRAGIARLLFTGLLAMASPQAHADELLKAKVGVLRLSSSAPVFIAQDKGYFRDAGLDIDLKFFDAAPADRGRDHVGRYRFRHHRFHRGTL